MITSSSFNNLFDILVINTTLRNVNGNFHHQFNTAVDEYIYKINECSANSYIILLIFRSKLFSTCH